MIKIPECVSAERVFAFFEEISKIPHASGNTAPIAEYLVDFANQRGLRVIRDEADNVIIKKPATHGYENRPGIVFQGHTDMVPAVDESVGFDFDKDALRLRVDGDFLSAEGTTLGADDGIAVAYALAILDSDSIEHPDFEAVFTSNEEIGLLGAGAIDGGNIDGRLLINIDSDAEGIFTVGCAGGLRCDLTDALSLSAADGYLYSLSLSSLRGGHSGVNINSGRVNAIKALFDILAGLGDIRLASIDGGNADNAIPRDASATFLSKVCINDRLTEAVSAAKASLTALGEEEASIIWASIYEEEAKVISLSDTERVISLVRALPSGVLAMSEDIEGLVETSQNLGVVKMHDGRLTLTLSVRSAKGAKKREAAENIASIARHHGMAVSEHGEYPSWEYKEKSYLREVMCRVYEDMYKTPAKVVIIHAGLECGLLTDKIDGLDCLSLGPDTHDIHTPSERLSISSAVRVWKYLLEVLKRI